MVALRVSQSPKRTFSASWIAVVRVKANSRRQRKEEDQCEILSGIFEGKTIGTPIAIAVGTKTRGLKITARSRPNFGRHMPTTLTSQIPESETGRVVAARLRAKTVGRGRGRCGCEKGVVHLVTRILRSSPT